MSNTVLVPFRLTVLAVLVAGTASGQGDPPESVEARVAAVFAEHVGGDLAPALARLDALVGAEGVDPAPIRASRYRLRMALGQGEAAAEDLRWLLEQAGPRWRDWALARVDAGEVPDGPNAAAIARLDQMVRAYVSQGALADRRRVVRLGAAAVPSLLRHLHSPGDSQRVVEALVEIDAPMSIEWLVARLRGDDDPVVGQQIAAEIGRAPESMRTALASAALDSPDPTIRRYGLAAWPGEYGERELAVARASPEMAAMAALSHDPRGARGLQQAVWAALGADGRREFARTAVRADLTDVDPDLLPGLLQWPDVTLAIWDRLPRDVRRGAQDAAGAALRAMRGTTPPALARGTATTQTGSGRSPWSQLLDDAVEFGWRGLVDDLLALLDHPDRSVATAASHALYRVAPQELFENYRATDREVPDELWLRFGTRDHLDAMVRAFLGLFRNGGVQEPAEALLERILDVATAADLPRLDAVHRKLMVQSFSRRLIDAWLHWLQRHAAAITAARLLDLEPRDGAVLAAAGAAATAQDIPAIGAAVRASLAAGRRAEAAFLVDTLQRLDARDALTGLAGEHSAVLGWIADGDLDRAPLWRQHFADGVDAAELDTALRDPQVAADEQLAESMLSAILSSGDLPDSVFVGLEEFLGRLPPESARFFPRALWKQLQERGIDTPTEGRIAAVALARLGAGRDPAMIPWFAEALALGDAAVQLAAVEQLARTFSPAAVPPLLDALKSDAAQVAAAAEQALERLDRYFRAERGWRERFEEIGVPWPESQPARAPEPSGRGR